MARKINRLHHLSGSDYIILACFDLGGAAGEGGGVLVCVRACVWEGGFFGGTLMYHQHTTSTSTPTACSSVFAAAVFVVVAWLHGCCTCCICCTCFTAVFSLFRWGIKSNIS